MKQQLKKCIIIYGLFAFLLLDLAMGSRAWGQSTDAFSDWMGMSKASIGDLAINEVVLLGSHDALSYDIQVGAWPCVGYRTRSNKSITRKATSSDVLNAQCQSGSLTAQLASGVRYFDLRIALQDEQYWGVHMWLSTLLFESDKSTHAAFAQVREYLNFHPSEIIILNINELYSDTTENGQMTSKQVDSFFSDMCMYFDDKLIPVERFSNLTLNRIWSNTGRIVLINSSGISCSNPYVWNNFYSSTVPPEKHQIVDSRWMSKAKTPLDLCEELEFRVLDSWAECFSEYSKQLRVLQCMVATSYKIRDAYGTDKILEQQFLSYWRSKYPINIIQINDSTQSSLMPLIVNLNNCKAIQ